MSGLGLMIAFVIAIIVMIVAISKYKIHPFLSIMTVSLVLGLVAGIPLVDTKVDGKTVQGIATVIGSGFSGTFTSVGIVIILSAAFWKLPVQPLSWQTLLLNWLAKRTRNSPLNLWAGLFPFLYSAIPAL